MHTFLLILAIAITAVTGGGCSGTTPSDPQADIRAVIDTQVEAWNRGDIEAYLDTYIRSPALVFASRGTFSRGWDPLLERYRVSYPQGEMGTLRIDGVEIHMIGNDDAWLIGSWWLDKGEATPHGVFTLVLRRTDDGWKIVHDHSSGVDLPAEE